MVLKQEENSQILSVFFPELTAEISKKVQSRNRPLHFLFEFSGMLNAERVDYYIVITAFFDVVYSVFMSNSKILVSEIHLPISGTEPIF